MNLLFKRTLEKVDFSNSKAAEISKFETEKPISIFWELRTLLYLGITCFTSGTGILIYQNIDSIGHGVLIAFLILLCFACFYYAFKNKKNFIWLKVENSGFKDFSILGACLLFLTIEGYLQYQYNVFGNSYGLATIIPAVLFLYVAYLFDHQGVLSMGITALGSWLGLTIAPKDIISTLNITNHDLIYTGIVFGFLLIVIGWISEFKNLKRHFSFSYYLFGANLCFISLLTALFIFDYKLVFFVLIIALSILSIIHARKTKSFFVLIIGVIYGYIGFTYYFFAKMPDDLALSLGYLYFSISCGGVVYFLFNIKSILGISKAENS